MQQVHTCYHVIVTGADLHAAAQQIEGAVKDDGRGESIWDRFATAQPEKVQDGSNGNIVGLTLINLAPIHGP
jgi:hypothetical protein